jgi:hypothetical protein
MRHSMLLVGLGALLIAAGLPLGSSQAQIVQVSGLGEEGQGADLAVLDLDPGGPDMIVMAYDNPPGANTFRYRVGKNLNASGIAAGGWSAPVIVPGVGWEGQGAGVAVAYLDANPRPELILMAYDNPAGGNSFRYMVGWNLNANGIAASWANFPQIPGVGWEAQGAAAAVGQIDANPMPDMVFLAFDNPPGFNSWRYRIGFNLKADGNATSWMVGAPFIRGAPLSEAQGAGVALTNLDANPRPELVLMTYVNPVGANNFYYLIGWNLNAAGVATTWSAPPMLSGVGAEGQGAGVALACLDSDRRRDWIFMAYDNPPGANSFRYVVRPNLTGAATCP